MSKTFAGYFFDDYEMGQIFEHAVPRTIGAGERALYHALYPARTALFSSDAFARECGLPAAPLDPLIVFHTVFGKTVPDISLNAVANLGYAEGRFLKPVYEGTTLRSVSEVIGLKQNSNGKTGIVYVRTQGLDETGEAVLSYVRWVMIKKRDMDAPAPKETIPALSQSVSKDDLVIPANLDFSKFNTTLSGEAYTYKDYKVGEIIDHVDGVTISQAEHMMATRLWQNTSKVHFDTLARPDGQRLIYGGHIISLAHTLSFNGLANAAPIVAINGGAHVSPAFADDRISAYSEILDKAEISENIGALRIRLVARKGDVGAPALKEADDKYLPDVLLDFDYWCLIPA